MEVLWKLVLGKQVLPTTRHVGRILKIALRQSFFQSSSCYVQNNCYAEHLMWDLCNDFETAWFETARLNRMVLIHVLGSRKGSTHQSIKEVLPARIRKITKANHNFWLAGLQNFNQSSLPLLSCPQIRFLKAIFEKFLEGGESKWVEVIALPWCWSYKNLSSKLRFCRE